MMSDHTALKNGRGGADTRHTDDSELRNCDVNHRGDENSSPESRETCSSVSSVVGWYASSGDGNNDLNIPKFCSRMGTAGYSFVNYPIGGITRETWIPQRNTSPPPIQLPDMQLCSELWSTYVIGRVSRWIDCDSEEEWIAELSCREIEKELNYVAYMPMRVITIELKHRDSPRLAEVLTRWFWVKNMNFSIWIFIPTDDEQLPPAREADARDLWSIWADFRTLCTNYPLNKLCVGLKICSNLSDEFSDSKLYERWKSEPLAAFWFDSSSFMSHDGLPKLSVLHHHLFSDLFVTLVQRAIISSDEGVVSLQLTRSYAAVIKRIVQDKINSSQDRMDPDIDSVLMEYLGHPEYVDTLQIPLQPLSDNLDSGTYTTFEEDTVKYDRYRDAIYCAINDLVKLVKDKRPIVVFVLGAGRGPLVEVIIDAENKYNEENRCHNNRLSFDLVAVEKNASAIVTLRYRNNKQWNSRVYLVESDMRNLPKLVASGSLSRPDLIVSELLGSFGDNELSPECLDGVTDILHENTISIPQKYTSYVAPIQSIRMHQKVLSCSDIRFFDKGLTRRGRLMPQKQLDGSFAIPPVVGTSPLDEIYVVCLRSMCLLDEPKPVFTFEHPNFKRKPNVRKTTVNFDIRMQSELMGFAAYFDAQLYGDVWLSIVPHRHSKSMVSWFPALIPLRKLERLWDGSKIDFHIERKVDDGGVWYEWFLDCTDGKSGEIRRSVLQNENGMSYYMHI